jgi:hypothetical protein
MKPKQSQILFAALLAASPLAAQDATNTEEASEIGLQQVVETHDGPSVSAGYQFQFIYRDNPFYVDAPPLTPQNPGSCSIHSWVPFP